jgi:hypothetical protein
MKAILPLTLLDHASHGAARVLVLLVFVVAVLIPALFASPTLLVPENKTEICLNAKFKFK